MCSAVTGHVLYSQILTLFGANNHMQPEGALKCAQNFSRKTWGKKNNFTHLGLDGTITFVLKKQTVNV